MIDVRRTPLFRAVGATDGLFHKVLHWSPRWLYDWYERLIMGGN